MVNTTTIASAIQKQFSYIPTPGQEKLIQRLSHFIHQDSGNQLFILKGYAGTGKTTIISALVNVLPQFGMQSVLLAPTGRAAKVLSSYSGHPAHTIHRKIYFMNTASDGRLRIVIQKNQYKNAVFIVDEASMINDNYGQGQDLFAGSRLLEDLFSYVRSGTQCKIIFVGDTAQLPPVGLSESPALDRDYLTASFQLNIETLELTDVVRQAEDSGILYNATFIRNLIQQEHHKFPFFHLKDFPDIVSIQGQDLEDYLHTAYGNAGREGTLIICRSNKRANLFNNEVRNRIMGYDTEINAGDMLMCVRNNYFWLPEESKAGFLANGDMMEILRIKKTMELYGHRFADIQVRLVDFPEEKELEIRIMLDTLTLDGPALPQKDQNAFFEEVMLDYMDLPQRAQRLQKIRENPFYNAVQVKFAYALTCHKSQGGQWENVFVEQGYLKDEMINQEYLRWLYTAVTRASKKLHLVNFSEKFFGE